MNGGVIAHGVDLVHVPRIARMWEEYGARFLRRVYSEAEGVYCTDCKEPAVRLAGRFAVKEAVMKLLGTGWRGGIEFADIETLPDPAGRPYVTLSGPAAKLAEALGIRTILVSISHTGEYAIASAVGVG